MFSKNIIPMAGLELAQGHGGVAKTDHSVSALGSSIGTLMRCSIGLDILESLGGLKQLLQRAFLVQYVCVA